MILLKTVTSRVVNDDEELFHDDLETFLRFILGDGRHFFVGLEHVVDLRHEVLQRVLVQIVDDSHALHSEEDASRHGGEWDVLIGDFFDLLEGLIRLGHLLGNLSCLLLQTLKLLNELVILQDFALGVVEGV